MEILPDVVIHTPTTMKFGMEEYATAHSSSIYWLFTVGPKRRIICRLIFEHINTYTAKYFTECILSETQRKIKLIY